MDGVRRMVRSGSLIVEELFGNKRTETEPAEMEWESRFSGEFVPRQMEFIVSYLFSQSECFTIINVKAG